MSGVPKRATIVVRGKETVVDVTRDTVLSGLCDHILWYAARRRGIVDVDVFLDARLWVAERVDQFCEDRASFPTFLIRYFWWSLCYIVPKHAPCLRLPTSEYLSGIWPRTEEQSSGRHATLTSDSDPASDALSSEIRAAIEAALDALPPDERAVMERRLPAIMSDGMASSDISDCSMSAIGMDLGVSKQRVCQIQQSAMKRMRKKLASIWESFSTI